MLQNFRFGHDPSSRPAVTLSEVSAQDLLGKSHEELVLLLIHLRRQSAYLNEAIDATRDELQQLAEVGAAAAQDENRALLADLQVRGRISVLMYFFSEKYLLLILFSCGYAQE